MPLSWMLKSTSKRYSQTKIQITQPTPIITENRYRFADVHLNTTMLMNVATPTVLPAPAAG
jgi:hypothetical protein